MKTLMTKISYDFSNEKLLEQALTHTSFYNENTKTCKGDNERLEFLGDAVLDLNLSHMLMEAFPDVDEGELSKMRASMVNETKLNEIGKSIELDQYVRLGKGEEQTGGNQKPRIVASVFEALIGAVYLDAGYDSTFEMVKVFFKDHVKDLSQDQKWDQDFKTRLQELFQTRRQKVPVYTVIKEEGPDHNKVFHVQLSVDGKPLAVGMGKSKKIAEQMAAKNVLESANGL